MSYFYDVANAPMSSWTFDATNWSASCSPTSGFPTLAFQNLASVSKCNAGTH